MKALLLAVTLAFASMAVAADAPAKAEVKKEVKAPKAKKAKAVKAAPAAAPAAAK